MKRPSYHEKGFHRWWCGYLDMWEESWDDGMWPAVALLHFMGLLLVVTTIAAVTRSC